MPVSYLFSLRNKSNYKPLYVASPIGKDFLREVFNKNNLVEISHHWRATRGTICLHLLAKPKASHSGFSTRITADELRWLDVMPIFSGERRTRTS